MGTHGRSGPGCRLHGSVADEVLRASVVPVVLVPPSVASAWPPSGPHRIVVTLDESKLSEAALGPAVELARAVNSEILLVEVVPLPADALYDNGAAIAAFEPDKELANSEEYLARVAGGMRSAGVQVRTRTELAKPADAIIDIAAQEKAGLIVMATHGRSGVARLVLGSVASAPLRRTQVPLMLIGPAVVQTAVTLAEAVTAAPVA